MRARGRLELPVSGVRLSLWRAAVAFRVAALAVCLFLVVRWQPIYARPAVALIVGAAMVLVTAALAWLGLRGRAHRPWTVATDVVVTAGLTLLTIPAQTGAQLHGGMTTLTTIWAAGPTIEAAFLAGPLGGLVAGALQFGATVIVRDGYDGRTLNSGVLLLVTGAVVGLVATYTVRAEDDLREATATQAALAERERLARSIHDGVLQVLGLVHRNGREAGGEWGRIAAAAAEQEAALRGLITSRPVATGSRESDLADRLRVLRTAHVTVSTPPGTVPLAGERADELIAAVRAALDNVEAHAGTGAQAWVLLEDEEDLLRVTVRDDGRGMAEGCLARAEADGRIGVARSIRGRISDLGGSCSITSAPGAGTQVELVVPR